MPFRPIRLLRVDLALTKYRLFVLFVVELGLLLRGLLDSWILHGLFIFEAILFSPWRVVDFALLGLANGNGHNLLL